MLQEFLPDWAIFALGVLWFGGSVAALAWLARCQARDAAHIIAAAYWAGQGDMDRARRIARGEKS